ncbi:hypothetical protein [Staphylococcus capitis]|nr:hypothetical protein [Staphylococcus capitis]
MKEVSGNDENIGRYLVSSMGGKGFGRLGKYVLGIMVGLGCMSRGCGVIV